MICAVTECRPAYLHIHNGCRCLQPNRCQVTSNHLTLKARCKCMMLMPLKTLDTRIVVIFLEIATVILDDTIWNVQKSLHKIRDHRHAGLCLSRRWCVQERSQGTILHASDLHNARATILNPFYNMECKMIKKTCQNKMWIEADIPCINLTPNLYIALAPAIVYVISDVTIPVNSMTSQ